MNKHTTYVIEDADFMGKIVSAQFIRDTGKKCVYEPDRGLVIYGDEEWIIPATTWQELKIVQSTLSAVYEW